MSTRAERRRTGKNAPFCTTTGCLTRVRPGSDRCNQHQPKPPTLVDTAALAADDLHKTIRDNGWNAACLDQRHTFDCAERALEDIGGRSTLQQRYAVAKHALNVCDTCPEVIRTACEAWAVAETRTGGTPTMVAGGRVFVHGHSPAEDNRGPEARRAATLENIEFLARHYGDRHEVADRLGMTLVTLEKYVQRNGRSELLTLMPKRGTAA